MRFVNFLWPLVVGHTFSQSQDNSLWTSRNKHYRNNNCNDHLLCQILFDSQCTENLHHTFLDVCHRLWLLFEFWNLCLWCFYLFGLLNSSQRHQDGLHRTVQCKTSNNNWRRWKQLRLNVSNPSLYFLQWRKPVTLADRKNKMIFRLAKFVFFLLTKFNLQYLVPTIFLDFAPWTR